MWRGSALDCTGGSGISLRHGQFRGSGYANKTCNNGAILAHITNITGNCYVSQMVVNASLNFDGESVLCAYDDGTVETVVDTITIRITTGLIEHRYLTVAIIVLFKIILIRSSFLTTQ